MKTRRLGLVSRMSSMKSEANSTEDKILCQILSLWFILSWTSFKEIKNCRKNIFEFCFSTFDGKNHKLRIIKIIRQIIS